MTKTYLTKGTCSKKIDIEVEDGIIKSVKFIGGCDGNLKGISMLVAGRNVKEVADLLRGTKCGFKNTSCPDQLAQALDEIAAEE